MMPPTGAREDLARLLSRLSVFLDGAEEALSKARPEDVAQTAGQWAQLCRELRRVDDRHWPSPEHRAAVLGSMATRTAALQQAIVRAQARMEREIKTLAQAQSSAGSAPPWAGTALQPLTYDAGGTRTGASTTSGTYA